RNSITLPDSGDSWNSGYLIPSNWIVSCAAIREPVSCIWDDEYQLRRMAAAGRGRPCLGQPVCGAHGEGAADVRAHGEELCRGTETVPSILVWQGKEDPARAG